MNTLDILRTSELNTIAALKSIQDAIKKEERKGAKEKKGKPKSNPRIEAFAAKRYGKTA